MAHPDSQQTQSDERYTQSRLYQWLDERLDLDDELLGKAFPEDQYGSFLLGEVALFSFIILVATGTFLGLLYAPVATENFQYTGQVMQYAGKSLPGAFASVLRITYDVRLGMYIRMMHHWASYIFIAAIVLHMFRIFFSGVYRNPREPNWLIGSTLLLLSLVEGFFGYALPFDDFSQTATGIGFTLTQSIPVIGTRLTNLIFGGNFPSNAPYVIPRIFFFHVFLIPAIIAGLIAVHLGILLRQKHTEQKGSRSETAGSPDPDDDSVVMGVPAVPNQAAMSIVAFFFTAAIISFLAALFPLQRIALVGPASPFETPENVAPAWFFIWTYGSLKLALSSLASIGTFLFGVVLPSLLVIAMYLWVFYDTSDKPIHFTENPLDRPLATAVGVAVIALLIMLSIAGMKEIVAEVLHTTTGALQRPLQILTVVVPIIEGLIVYYMLRRRENRKQEETTPQSESTPESGPTASTDD
ncbi:MAG TPA: cytochrome bc complex cytochrome b subunit [Halococcus sp.]|nr:cytochrome bc complex cytochrome b subunit [Halococcus sp.]